MNIDLIAFNCRYTHSCLALFYLRNELEKRLPSSSVTILQRTINDPYFETLLRITERQADALFFSVYIWNATYLARLLADLRNIQPDLPIVLGGPHAPSLRDTLSFRPTVVHNQVEGVGDNFYWDLRNGTLQSDYYAEPVVTFGYPYKQEDFQDQLKNRHIYYESSRGCPFHCAYCLSSISRGVVFKDLEMVKRELRDIIGHSPKTLRFVDRTFNADPDRALQIWEFINVHADNSCCFHFEIAPDLFTEAMFGFLGGIAPGFFRFEIGVQSTNPATLQAVNRKMNLEKSFATIKRLRHIGTVTLHVDLILGLPNETVETFAQSIRDVLAVQPDYVQMGLLKVLPDTAICKSAREFEVVSCGEPPYQVVATKWMDHRSMARLYWLGECVEAFYNKHFFATFFSYVLKDEDPYIFCERLLSECQGRDFFSRAKTHELMNEILFAVAASYERTDLWREFLVFDWLLCGHRFLPDIFNVDLRGHKDFLWGYAPQEVLDLYTQKDRAFFFKKATFCKFSSELLLCCDVPTGSDGGFVGFFASGVCGKIVQAVFLPDPTLVGKSFCVHPLCVAAHR